MAWLWGAMESPRKANDKDQLSNFLAQLNEREASDLAVQDPTESVLALEQRASDSFLVV